MLFSITFPEGAMFSGLLAWSGTYTPSFSQELTPRPSAPERMFRSATFGPPIVLDEFSSITPAPLGAAVSPVGSVPMKQPATWTLPPAVISTPAS
jgi:hypothetical protein